MNSICSDAQQLSLVKFRRIPLLEVNIIALGLKCIRVGVSAHGVSSNLLITLAMPIFVATSPNPFPETYTV
jgi:hypothetical protein